MDNEKGSHYWIWIALGLTFFTITVGAGILLYIEWTWEPPEDLDDHGHDIPKFKAKAVSTNDTVEVIPLDRTLSWHDYGITVRFNDDNRNRTHLVTNSSKTEISGIAFFTGIDFDPGDEFDVGLIDIEMNAVVYIVEVRAI